MKYNFSKRQSTLSLEVKLGYDTIPQVTQLKYLESYKMTETIGFKLVAGMDEGFMCFCSI
jgi:hypothetical protein